MLSLLYYILLLYRLCTFSLACEGYIECQLWNLMLSLPDTCEDSSDGVVCLENMYCEEFVLDHILSDYVNPLKFSTQIVKLSGKCYGDWGLGNAMRGVFDASLNQANADMMFSFTKSDLYPQSIVADSCSTPDVSVSCALSWGNVDMRAVSNTIERVIERAINTVICDKLVVSITSNATALIQNTIDPVLFQLVNVQADALPVMPTETIMWGSAVRKYDLVRYISESSCIGSAFDWMVGAFFNKITNNTGILHIPVDLMISAAEAYPRSSSSIRDVLDSVLDFVKLQFLSTTTSSVHFSVSFLEISDLNSIYSNNEAVFSAANASFNYKVNFQTVNLKVGVNIDAVDDEGNNYSRTAVIDTELTGVHVFMSVLVALNSTSLSSLYVDQFINPSCLIGSLIYPIGFSSIDIVFDSFAIDLVSDVSGNLESDFIVLLNEVFQLVATDYSDVFVGTVRGVIQGPVRHSLNEMISLFLSYSVASRPCDVHVPYYIEKLISWKNSSVIKIIDYIFNYRVGYAGVNRLLSCITNGTGHLSVNYIPEMLSSTLPGYEVVNDVFEYAAGWVTTAKEAAHRIVNKHVRRSVGSETPSPHYILDIFGLDTFFDFSLLVPSTSKDYNLNVSVGVGGGSLNNPNRGNYGPNPFCLSITSVGTQNITFRWNASDVLLSMDVMAKVDQNAMYNMGVNEISKPGCAMTAVRDAELEKIDVLRGNATFDFMLNQELVKTAVIPPYNLVEIIKKSGALENLNGNIDYSLSSASVLCETGELPSSSSSSVTPTYFIWHYHSWELVYTACAVVSVVVFMWFGVPKLLSADVSKRSSVCANSSELSVLARLGVPAGCLFNIHLFVLALLSVTSSCMLSGVYRGDPWDYGSFFDFTFKITIDYMYGSKEYILAAICAFLTGGWTFIRVVGTIICWVAPNSIVSKEFRGEFLFWAEVLGKYAFAYVLVLYLLTVGFAFDMPVSNELTWFITVKPGFGCYSFICATLFSMVLGRLALVCHRRVVWNVSDDVYDEAKKCAIVDSTFIHRDCDFDEGKSRAKSFTITARGKYVIISVICCTIIALLCGILFNSFQFLIRGLAGFFIGDSPVFKFNLYSLATTLPDATGEPHFFGSLLMMAFFLGITIIFPLLLMIMSLVLAFVPLTTSQLFYVLNITEIVNALSLSDVSLIAITCTVIDIRIFALFVLGDHCDKLNDALAKYMDGILDENVCFDLQASFLPGVCALFFCGVFVVSIGVFLIRLGWNAFHLRTKKQANIDDEADSILRDAAFHTKTPLLNSDSMNPRLFHTNTLMRWYYVAFDKFVDICLYSKLIEESAY